MSKTIYTIPNFGNGTITDFLNTINAETDAINIAVLNSYACFTSYIKCSSNCCGLYEIGSFGMNDNFLSDDLFELIDGIPKNYPHQLFATTSCETSLRVRNAFQDSEEWIIAKTFFNPKTSNEVTMWLSKQNEQ